MESKKRKRDLVKPRITYHAENRTFDRLFKDESLEETKDAIRQKLHLPPDTVIHLEQLRDGMTIDLEDDDDFEAFRVLAHSMPSVDIRVKVISPAAGTFVAKSHEIIKKDKKKRQSSALSQVRGSDTDHAHTNTPSTDGRKRKNNVESNTPSASNTDGQPKRKKQKNDSGHVQTADAPHVTESNILAERDKILRDVLLVLGGGEEPRSDILGMNVPSKETEPTTSAQRNGKKTKGSKSSENIHGASTAQPPQDSGIKASGPSDIEAVYSNNKGKITGRKKRKMGADSTSMQPSNTGGTEKSSSPLSPSMPTPFPEQLAGAISKMSETTQRHLMEGTVAQSRRSSNSTTIDQADVFKDIEVPFAVVIDSTPKPRFPVKKSAGKKKRGESAVVDSRQDDEAFPSAKSVKGKQKEPPSERDNEIIKAAFSRVLAKNPAKHHVLEKTDCHEETNAEKSKEEVDEEVRRPVGKSKSKSIGLRNPKNLQPKASERKSVEPESSVVCGQTDLAVSPRLRRASLTTPKVSKGTKGKGTKSDLLPCPVCLQTPFHLRYRCPIILAGNDAIKARLRELKEKDPDGREQLIEELETLLKSRGDDTAKDRRSNVNADSTFLSSVPARAAQQTPSDASGHVADTSLPDSAALASSDNTNRMFRRPNIPVSTQISEITVESLDESGNNEDTDDESDESNKLENIDSEYSSNGQTTSTPISYANIDLDKLVRGPANSRTIADILDEDGNGEDEDQENFLLEEDEEDDAKFRRLSKRFKRVSPSSSDDDRELDIEGSEPSLDDPVENQQIDTMGQSSSTESISFRAIASRSKSPDIDRTGDAAFSEALAEDTAALKMATDDSEDDTRVAPSAEIDDKNDASLVQPSRKEAPLNLLSGGGETTHLETATIDPTVAQSAPEDGCTAEVDQTTHITPPASCSSWSKTGPGRPN